MTVYVKPLDDTFVFCVDHSFYISYIFMSASNHLSTRWSYYPHRWSDQRIRMVQVVLGRQCQRILSPRVNVHGIAVLSISSIRGMYVMKTEIRLKWNFMPFDYIMNPVIEMGNPTSFFTYLVRLRHHSGSVLVTIVILRISSGFGCYFTIKSAIKESGSKETSIQLNLMAKNFDSFIRPFRTQLTYTADDL